jgi:hypothetical protein
MLARQPMLWSVKPGQVQGRIDQLAGWLGCSEVRRQLGCLPCTREAAHPHATAAGAPRTGALARRLVRLPQLPARLPLCLLRSAAPSWW